MLEFDRNTPHNSLPKLPTLEDIESNVQVLKKLVTASRALATVNGNISRLPNPHMLVNTIALQEARTSTEIENIFTTEDELYRAVSDKNRDKNVSPATKEVLRYRESLWAGYHSMQVKNSIDVDLIIKIFQQIKNTNATIRSPQAKIFIKRGESEYRSGEVIYTPPRGEGIVEELLVNLVEYLNDDEKYPIDPLLKMCIAHYQFEAIHPFVDGNGRTGRIINLLYLVQKKLITYPTLYLSKYIIKNKDDYYYRIAKVTQKGDWSKWVEYMLEGVEKTSMLTNSLINEILGQMESTFAYGKGKIKWYSKEVNEVLFSQPYIRPNVLGELLGKKSRTTLNGYFKELIDCRILSPKKDGKEVFYVNDDLIRILEG